MVLLCRSEANIPSLSFFDLHQFPSRQFFREHFDSETCVPSHGRIPVEKARLPLEKAKALVETT